MMRKNFFICGTAVAVLMSASIYMGGEQADAHGYVSNPVSRVKNAKANGFGWGPGEIAAPTIISTPQGVEPSTALLNEGKLDGHLPSGGLDGYALLDEQTSSRWVKSIRNTGVNDFTWYHTQPHETSTYRYFMTKQGWNQNAPINLKDMELIGTIEKNGQNPAIEETHKVTIPADRSGYHVVYSVWDVANGTAKSFVQAIDLNIKDDSSNLDITAPTVPTNLKSEYVFHNELKLSWGESIDTESGLKEYQIFRDGKKIDTSVSTEYIDTTVKENAKYNYTIKAVDRSGNVSNASNKLSIQTPVEQPTEDDKIAPSTPDNLHSMGETTDSIDLMWNKSEDNVGVVGYNIYRDGKKIKSVTKLMYTDINLKANTSYKYSVTAFDNAGNESVKSNLLTVSTKEEDESSDKDTWEKDITYHAGDKVIYKGHDYTAKWETTGEAPDSSSVWEVAEGSIVEWNSEKGYHAKELVSYNEKTYEAQYYTLGNEPGTSSLWKLKEKLTLE